MNLQDRNQKITEAALRGELYKDIGPHYGVTQERARQIARKNGVPKKIEYLTENQQDIIRALAQDCTTSEIAEMIGRKPETVYSFIRRHDIDRQMINNAWTDAETKLLRALYPTHSARRIGLKLDRTRNEVIGKAYRLGLAKKQTNGQRR